MRDLQDWHKKVELDARAAQRALEQMRRTADLLPASSQERQADLVIERPAENTQCAASNGLDIGPRRVQNAPVPTGRRVRGPRPMESREELISRLLDPTLTLEETARVLEVCPTTVRRYTNRGLLQHERSKGNQRRFKLSAVLAFLESQGVSADRRDEDG